MERNTSKSGTFPLPLGERVRVRGSINNIQKQWQEFIIRHIVTAQKPLLVILGPTASGKTAFSLEVARFLSQHAPHPAAVAAACTLPRGEGKAEIINADSRQLYKYLDIGTAKITSEEMGNTPHHLFSVLDPKEKVTVGWYKREAEKVIDEVLARGNIPILVGGSMLYISAVTDGYVFTGRGGKRRTPVPYDILILGLHWPRAELVRRIGERTCSSLSPRERDNPKNWISEVSWLLTHGYTVSDPGMESCGYREIAAWILGGKKEDSFQSLVESIDIATRRYAKRQMTWWKNDARIHWIPCSAQPSSPLPSSARRATTSRCSAV